MDPRGGDCGEPAVKQIGLLVSLGTVQVGPHAERLNASQIGHQKIVVYTCRCSQVWVRPRALPPAPARVPSAPARVPSAPARVPSAPARVPSRIQQRGEWRVRRWWFQAFR
eukprot:909232-Prorocentrum_minimum.AAC.1